MTRSPKKRIWICDPSREDKRAKITSYHHEIMLRLRKHGHQVSVCFGRGIPVQPKLRQQPTFAVKLGILAY